MKKGGLARRAGEINLIRKTHKNVLLLDSGDTFLGNKNVAKLRAKAVLSGMNIMKYDAINVGDGELSLGKGFFEHLTREFDVPFLSANIKNVPEIRPYIVKRFGNIRIGIIGISAKVLFQEDLLKKSKIAAISHLKALKKILPEMRKKVDMVILLSHLGYEGTLNLLRFNHIPGIDVAIGGHGRKLLDEPMVVNGTIVVQNSMGGEYLGFLQLKMGTNNVIEHYDGKVIALTDQVPEDKKAREIMDKFKEDKSEKEQALKEARLNKELHDKQTKILKMSPKEFLEMMKKKKASTTLPGNPPKVPLE